MIIILDIIYLCVVDLLICWWRFFDFDDALLMEEWYYNDFVMEKCTLDLKILAWKKEHFDSA